MTTVITNGYYLLADHRETETGYTGRKAPIATSLNTRRTVQYTDSSQKIGLVNRNKLLVRKTPTSEAYLVAFACAGDSLIIDYIHVFLNRLKADSLVRNDLIRRLCNDLKTADLVDILLVFSDGSTTIFSCHTGLSDMTVRTAGVLQGIGTGMSCIRPFLKFGLNKRPLHEIMAMASYMDRGTSTSYSVYGVRENHHYRCVDPGVSGVTESFNEIIGRHLDWSLHKPASYHNVSAVEIRDNDYKLCS